MTIQEQIIRDKAFAISRDAAFGIRPLTRPQAISWLRLAEKWANKNHATTLTVEIKGYLEELDALVEAPLFEDNSALALAVA